MRIKSHLTYSPEKPGSPPPPGEFEPFEEEEGLWRIRHIASGTTLKWRSKEEHVAMETCDSVNDFAKKSVEVMDRLVKNETNPKKKSPMETIRRLVHGDPNEPKPKADNQFKPKTKNRAHYQSFARKAFREQQNITPKEAIILEAVEEFVKQGRADVYASHLAEYITKKSGKLWTPNMVSGAVSVLLVKNICTTERHKNGPGEPIRQRISICFPEWRTILGRIAPRPVKAKVESGTESNDEE